LEFNDFGRRHLKKSRTFKGTSKFMNFKKGTSKLREGTGKSTSELRDVNLM